MLWLKVKLAAYYQDREESARYSALHQFWEKERALKRAYRLRNPYALCRIFQQKRGSSQIHPYGETPLITAEAIGRALNLTPSDTLYELGAGRGRPLLFYESFFGCRVLGIEIVKTFVQIGQKLGLPLVEGDYFDADLSEATAIYLYGSTLSRGEIETLCYKFRQLPKRPKIVTVSYPLTHYDRAFTVIHQFEGEFPWGKTTLFIHQQEAGYG